MRACEAHIEGPVLTVAETYDIVDCPAGRA